MTPPRFAVGDPHTTPPTYQPLADYLAVQARDRVAVSFGRLALMLGAALPADAWLRSWWRRSGPTHIAAVLAAVGWQVAWVDPAAERVVFRRCRGVVGGAAPARLRRVR